MIFFEFRLKLSSPHNGFFLSKLFCTLAGVSQWIERRSYSRSGYMPGLWATMQEATNRCFSPFLSPSLPLSLKKITNKIF